MLDLYFGCVLWQGVFYVHEDSTMLMIEAAGVRRNETIFAVSCYGAVRVSMCC